MKFKYQMAVSLISLFLTSVSLPATCQPDQSKFDAGDTAPMFEGTDQFGNDFNLEETLESGPVVLIFYRGYWCPYCSKQLSQLNDSLRFITERGGTVVAVTPEQPEGIDKTIKKTDASFKIIHDKDLKIMNTYEVGFRLDEATIRRYTRLGMNNGDNGPNLPVPATYIIGEKGKILYVFYDPDYKKRATVKRILENL